MAALAQWAVRYVLSALHTRGHRCLAQATENPKETVHGWAAAMSWNSLAFIWYNVMYFLWGKGYYGLPSTGHLCFLCQARSSCCLRGMLWTGELTLSFYLAASFWRHCLGRTPEPVSRMATPAHFGPNPSSLHYSRRSPTWSGV